MSESTHELVIRAIRDLAIKGELPQELATLPLAGDSEIDALAIDSLGKLNLLSELEERADVTLSERDLIGLRTLADLAALLVRLRRA